MTAARGLRAPGLVARGAARLATLGVLLALTVGSLHAQDGQPLYLSVRAEDGAAQIRIGNLFDEPGLVNALHSGLPLRIQIVAELWKDGFFDRQKGRAEWRATVLFDPLEQRYRVATGAGGSTELSVDSLGGVRDVLQAEFNLPLRPSERGRYYYLGEGQVETLSLSDLEELQRWLRGDLASAVSGEEKLGTAVGRGVHRVVVRMLGLSARRFRVRSEAFEMDNPEEPNGGG